LSRKNPELAGLNYQKNHFLGENQTQEEEATRFLWDEGWAYHTLLWP
jgi:hypothetical protein